MNRPLALLLACVVIFLYVRSPVDLLPDYMGLIGVLDDLALSFFVVWWMRNRLGVQPRARTTPRQRARGPAGFGAAGGAGASGGQAGARDDAASGPPPWDPYAVLGVARGASAEEIGRAYRTQMKLYHPDRVADLGPELQEVAHRKAVDIQRAYEEIGAR